MLQKESALGWRWGKNARRECLKFWECTIFFLFVEQCFDELPDGRRKVVF